MSISHQRLNKMLLKIRKSEVVIGQMVHYKNTSKYVLSQASLEFFTIGNLLETWAR